MQLEWQLRTEEENRMCKSVRVNGEKVGNLAFDCDTKILNGIWRRIMKYSASLWLLWCWHLKVKKVVKQKSAIYDCHGTRTREKQENSIARSLHFRGLSVFLTFFLSLMEPFPRTMILQPVSCSSCFAVIPLGPSIRPTKLNCKRGKKNYIILISISLIIIRHNKKS